MKTKRNRILNLLVLTLLSLFLSFEAFGAEGLIYFSDPVGVTGEDIEVEMTVQADGSSIADVTVMLRYPGEKLEFINGTKASGGAGTIRINGKGTSVSESKLTYILTFRASNAGEYTVDIPESGTCEVYDSNGSKINITHYGSSKITVTGDPVNTDVLQLNSLEVSPGKLNPSFSSDHYEYDVTVGLSVDRLTINALPADQTSEVTVSGNDGLKEGENLVTVSVKSKDGQIKTDYQLKVLKTEGGEENIASSAEESTGAETATGIQLTGKGKTITIIDIDEDVPVPDGFRVSKIVIDKKDTVKGWINEDGDDPQYFLVYGMNEDGEIDFYRYDLKEKTIQRYFKDSTEAEGIPQEEFDAVNAELTRKESDLHNSKLLIWILAIIIFLFVCLIIYLIIRLRSVSRELDDVLSAESSGRNYPAETRKSGRTRSSMQHSASSNMDPERYGTAYRSDSVDDSDDDDDDDDEDSAYSSTSDETIIKSFHDTGSRRVSSSSPVSSMSSTADIGETRVLSQNERRRTSRKADRPSAADSTTVLRRTSQRRNHNYDDFED